MQSSTPEPTPIENAVEPVEKEATAVEAALIEAAPRRNFHPPQVGEEIRTDDGRVYWIGKLIGSGAFGSVFECWDEWGNELAAKVLHPRGTYKEVRDQWLQELEKLLNLRHPNITFIHAAFEYRHTFYLIIERCAYSLTALIETPAVDPEIWIPYVARDILQALNFIHSRGYAHKDIHPGNVFIFQARDLMVPSKEPVWSFKVGDLGIARLENDIRVFNTLLAEWMLPPEAIDPEFGRVCRSVDIYHTGLLLMSLLNRGTPAFTRDDIVAGKPRDMAEALSSRYAGVIAKSLRRHVDARYQTPMEFWRELASASWALPGASLPAASSVAALLEVESDHDQA
jgi:serine/threonine-protein kinase